jgi:hypothetical protein
MLFIKYFIFFICLNAFSQSTERAFYVSSNGNDNNDGLSESTAYRTLEKALNRSSNSSIKKIVILGTIIGNHMINNTGSYEILITGKPLSNEQEMSVIAGDAKNSTLNISGNIKIKFENIIITNTYIVEEKGELLANLNPVFRGGGIYIRSMATVTLGKNAVVGGNQADYGGGVYVEDATLILDGGMIYTNVATTSSTWDSGGGGVYLSSNGNFLMKNGTVSNNTAISGGGVYVKGTNVPLATGKAIFTMSGGTIKENYAIVGGGIASNSSFIMEGGRIENNIAENYGGGIYGDFLIRNGVIENNTASKGGGIYSNVRNRIISGNISKNIAQYGAGVYIERNTFTFSGGSISGNNAKFVGGGIYVQSGSVLSIENGRTTGNIAGDGEGENIFRQ